MTAPAHLRPSHRQERLLTFDLLEYKMHTYKKDKEKKEFSLNALAGVQTADGSGAKALELTITFKETHAYHIRCRSQEQYDALLVVLRRITGVSELNDESLNLLIDDSSSPPSSVHKSKVIKRAEKMGSSLVHDWQPRFMVMGTTQLIIFRDVELLQLVNIIPLSLLKLSPDNKDPTCFMLSTSYWKASFRVLTAEVAARWKTALAEQTRDAKAGIKRAPSRPSVIYSDRDLADFHANLPKVLPVAGGARPGDLLPLSENAPIMALPAPELAQADMELSDGWLQYTTDDGNKYFFNSVTNEAHGIRSRLVDSCAHARDCVLTPNPADD